MNKIIGKQTYKCIQKRRRSNVVEKFREVSILDTCVTVMRFHELGDVGHRCVFYAPQTVTVWVSWGGMI